MYMTLGLAIVLLLLLGVVGAYLNRSWSLTALDAKALRAPVIVFLIVTIGLALWLRILPGEQGFVRYFASIIGALVVGGVMHLVARRPTANARFQALAGYFFYSTAGVYLVFMTTLRFADFLGREAPGPSVPITDPTDPAQRAILLSHAGNELDWSDSLTHAVRDRQFLDSAIGNRPVTTDIVGSIMPPRGAHLRERKDLALGQGRIVLRINLTDVKGNPYPPGPLGYHAADTNSRIPDSLKKRIRLPPGVSYVWIDSLVMRPAPDTTGVARSFIIPVNPAFPVLRGPPVTYYHHESKVSAPAPGYWFNRSFAKWTFGHGSGWTWANCATHGCCES